MRHVKFIFVTLVTSLLTIATAAQPITEKTRQHIFKGEINRSGKAVGCHHHRAVETYRTARLVNNSVINGPHQLFKAKVEIKDSRGRWIRKVSNGGYSTFFPKDWSEEKTEEEILKVYEGRRRVTGDLYEGKCSEGWIIQMYVSRDGRIATAFPRDWQRKQ